MDSHSQYGTSNVGSAFFGREKRPKVRNWIIVTLRSHWWRVHVRKSSETLRADEIMAPQTPFFVEYSKKYVTRSQRWESSSRQRSAQRSHFVYLLTYCTAPVQTGTKCSWIQNPDEAEIVQKTTKNKISQVRLECSKRYTIKNRPEANDHLHYYMCEVVSSHWSPRKSEFSSQSHTPKDHTRSWTNIYSKSWCGTETIARDVLESFLSISKYL